MSGGFLIGLMGLAVTALLDTSSGAVLAVTGSAVTSLGVQTSLALANEQIVATVPPDRVGTASGMGETGAELGNALGVAIGGSIVTVVYQVVPSSLPPTLPGHLVRALHDAFGGATDVPADLLAAVHTAFTRGVQIASVVFAVVALALAALTWGMRHEADRRAEPMGESEHTSPQADRA